MESAKRIFCLFLAVVLMLSALTACETQEDHENIDSSLYEGATDAIALTDKYEEHEFHVMLQISNHKEHGYFKLSIYYTNTFDVVDPESRTLWDIEHNGNGGKLTTPPEGSSDGNDLWEKCSLCHGSGRCTHCNGKGEVEKFQAGLGRIGLHTLQQRKMPPL